MDGEVPKNNKKERDIQDLAEAIRRDPQNALSASKKFSQQVEADESSGKSFSLTSNSLNLFSNFCKLFKLDQRRHVGSANLLNAWRDGVGSRDFVTYVRENMEIMCYLESSAPGIISFLFSPPRRIRNFSRYKSSIEILLNQYRDKDKLKKLTSPPILFITSQHDHWSQTPGTISSMENEGQLIRDIATTFEMSPRPRQVIIMESSNPYSLKKSIQLINSALSPSARSPILIGHAHGSSHLLRLNTTGLLSFRSVVRQQHLKKTKLDDLGFTGTPTCILLACEAGGTRSSVAQDLANTGAIVFASRFKTKGSPRITVSSNGEIRNVSIETDNGNQLMQRFVPEE